MGNESSMRRVRQFGQQLIRKHNSAFSQLYLSHSSALYKATSKIVAIFLRSFLVLGPGVMTCSPCRATSAHQLKAEPVEHILSSVQLFERIREKRCARRAKLLSTSVTPVRHRYGPGSSVRVRIIACTFKFHMHWNALLNLSSLGRLELLEFREGLTCVTGSP